MAYTKIERSQELLGLGITPRQICSINSILAEKADARILIVRMYKADIVVTVDTIKLKFKKLKHKMT